MVCRIALAALLLHSALAWASATGDDSEAGAEIVPPVLIHDSPARYPPELAREGRSGRVVLQLLIDANGEVESAQVSDASESAFIPPALHAAAGLRFEPARQGGRPIAVRILFTYNFEAPPPEIHDEPPPAMPTALIRGLVRTRGNRRPIPGAAVQLEDGSRVTQTDANGRFSLSVPVGHVALKVIAHAHQAQVFVEVLHAGDTLNVIYSLMPLRVDPYQTIVHGERERTEVSRVSLDGAEVHDVPGTMGDPFRVVMLLPGVTAMASGVAYPVVRGSPPASTGYFMDGIRVPLLFHLFLGPAVVSPDFIEGIDFFPGNAPPQYGRLLGGVIDGRISRPHDDRLHVTAYADVINAGGFVEYPIAETGTNFSVAGRYSYTPWLIALGTNALFPSDSGKLVLDFYDYQARLEQKLGEGRRLRLFAFGSSDVFGLKAGPEGFSSLQSIVFHRADLRYAQPLGTGAITVGATWGYDKFGVDSGDRTETSAISVLQHDYSLYGLYELSIGSHLKLLAGADVLQQRAELGIRNAQMQDGKEGPVLDVGFPLAIGTFAGAWAEAILHDENYDWTLIPGVRVDNYHLTPGINHFVAEPRLTVLHPVSDTVRLKAGAGLFHQSPTFLISVPVIDVASLQYGVQEALQLDVGVEWKVNRWFDLTADAYYNPLFRTIEVNPLDLGPTEPAVPGVNDGFGVGDPVSHGTAWGLEVMLRHPLGGNWFGWIAYSFQHSTRAAKVQLFNGFGEPDGTATRNVDFAFDQTHVLNAVLSYRFEGGWTVGGVFHLNSGRPELGEQRLGTARDFDGSTYEAWLPVQRDQLDRLPVFARLDLRVAKAFVFETITAEAYLDVLNVSFSHEVFGFEYLPPGSSAGSNPGGPHPTPTEKKAVSLPIVLPILGLRATY